MTENSLKRVPVKYLRDMMKSKYKTKEPCFICGCSDNIELHHLYSLSELWNSWLEKNKITISTESDILLYRKQFELDNLEMLSNDNLYSLCKGHHARLHEIYGKTYSNYTVQKVRNWLLKQKDKYGEK